MRQLNVKIIHGLAPYLPVWNQMRDFTLHRAQHPQRPDELWLLQHEPVFTQGKAGRAEHILNPHAIPIVHTDRGGQVTYHGPGQLMIYTLINITELKLNTRSFVQTLSDCIIDYLASLNIVAQTKLEAPGVYIDGCKLCSIGLRVRKGLAYHGLALNVDMDLTPFNYINPCGYQRLKMTQIKQYARIDIQDINAELLSTFSDKFGYNQIQTTEMTLTEFLYHG